MTRMIETPRHIIDAGIARAELPFAWDEWATKSYYWDVSQALFDRLNALTDEANIALTVALGEWVYHRFDSVSTDAKALLFLEAAWAGSVHPYYCIYTETVDDEWRGPIRGPQAVAIAIANDALFCRGHDPEVATRACWMHRLASHVLVDPAPLKQWFEAVVSRLEQFHRREASVDAPTSFFGVSLASTHPVPRDAFDVSRHYDAADAAAGVDRFLQGLDERANPFLRPRAELVDISDFVGEPYRFRAGV